MARQKGIVKLDGTLGGITFYKSQDGYLAREKGGVEASRIANDPAFARTRENGDEFGRAGKAGKMLRTAFRSLLQNKADSRMVSRLTADFVKVVQADATNDRGQRNVIDGGTLEVTIPAFVPINMVAAPAGITHFKIISAGAEVDFENETFTVDANDSAILPWDAVTTTALTLSNSVTANSTKPLFLVLGIEFYQQVNTQMYSLKNGAYNALALVQVSGQ